MFLTWRLMFFLSFVRSFSRSLSLSLSLSFLSKCRTSGNNSQNCTIFGAHGGLGCPFDCSHFDLGVTSRDLSMTLIVLNLGVSGG